MTANCQFERTRVSVKGSPVTVSLSMWCRARRSTMLLAVDGRLRLHISAIVTDECAHGSGGVSSFILYLVQSIWGGTPVFMSVTWVPLFPKALIDYTSGGHFPAWQRVP